MGEQFIHIIGETQVYIWHPGEIIAVVYSFKQPLQ